MPKPEWIGNEYYIENVDKIHAKETGILFLFPLTKLETKENKPDT